MGTYTGRGPAGVVSLSFSGPVESGLVLLRPPVKSRSYLGPQTTPLVIECSVTGKGRRVGVKEGTGRGPHLGSLEKLLDRRRVSDE